MKKRILIVEDVDMNRDLLCQILEEDYEVLQAVNGRDGLEKAKAEKPDLILTDMLMPEMSGVELAEALRRIHVPRRGTPRALPRGRPSSPQPSGLFCPNQPPFASIHRDALRDRVIVLTARYRGCRPGPVHQPS